MCAPTIVRIAHEQAARTGRRGFLGALGVTLSGVTALGAAAVARPARAHAAPPSGVVGRTPPQHPRQPIWPGSPPFTSAAVNTYDNGGFAQNMLAYWEHSGTHLDAPAHRAPGGAPTELVRAEDLVAPLVVVDISARAATDADAGLTVDDLERWQSEHGRIPPRAIGAGVTGGGSRLAPAAAGHQKHARGAPPPP
uniref:cyclase family protein n=1 Tax=Nocardia farcinica TaxID=37329 RepID=UPI00245541DA